MPVNLKFLLLISLTSIACIPFCLADISHSEANNGQLLMEDIPLYPQFVGADKEGASE